MNEILTRLYDAFYTRPPFEEEKTIIEDCHHRLIERLGKEERVLVLNIIDAQNHIKEIISMDSFFAGLQLGCQLAIELDHYKETHSAMDN